MSFTIAVAQTCPVAGDATANLEEHLQLVARAAQAGAALVVFPELSLTGYEIGLAEQLAFTMDDPRLAPLVEAAKIQGIRIVAGAPVRLGERLHIASLIFAPDGTTDLYTKRRLGAFGEAARVDGTPPPAEATVFAPGEHDPVVELGTPPVVAGFAICADVGAPDHPARAAARGVRAYLASMFVIPSEYDADAVRLQRYAGEHRMVVAMANYGGPTGGLRAAGRSAIWSPSGEQLTVLGPTGSGVAVGECSMVG